MRLPTDVRFRFSARFWVLGLGAMLSSCGSGGSDISAVASVPDRPALADAYGPEADYPLVVGAPYEVDGKLYTPLDTMNSDEVGYVVIDQAGGDTISVSHKTLPLPSYAEITSLDTGKTILARVARRGPMSNDHVVGLSMGASAQLGIEAGASVRVRRVNPPESERTQLRMGQSAALRLEAPKSLLAVLKRSLPAAGSASLASPKSAPVSVAAAPPSVNALPAATAAAPKPATASTFAKAFSGERKVVTAYPLKPMSGMQTAAAAQRSPAVAAAVPAPIRVNRNSVPSAARQAPVAQTNAVELPDEGAFVVQAAAFSNKANAERAANAINGFVEKSGRFFRVRAGPFANRGQAEAALAKVRAAGYSDARVFTKG